MEEIVTDSHCTAFVFNFELDVQFPKGFGEAQGKMANLIRPSHYILVHNIQRKPIFWSQKPRYIIFLISHKNT